MNATIDGARKMIKCPYCQDSGRIRRSHRRNCFERLLSLFGTLPYRCGECGNRFMLRSRGRRFKRPADGER
jgi:DNA-directed RNA polymerase subunit RPC12/RpoP